MGFSAGGHRAATLATSKDGIDHEERPYAVVLGYPVIDLTEEQATALRRSAI
ncbi:hypothetical protein [Nonomuraea typhae]|uniref:hypothetical protein n=1 Tax=Nonomuraea typhae TaxID=2603600 RepID=UPI0012F7CCBB